MSKTKKRLFYSAIVAAVVLLAFVAVVFMTSMTDNTTVIAETGEGQSALSTVTVPSSDSAYAEFGALDSLGGPGTIDSNDTITNNVVTGASAISSATQLDSALKTNGTYYLTGDINYTASTSNSSAAAGGSFSGVIYGNGHTVTVTVPQGTYTSSDNKNYGFLVKTLSGGTIRDLNLVIQAGGSGSVSFGKVLTNRSYDTYYITSGTSLQQYVMQIGGIAGEMTSGLIHNCTVTYSGNIRFIINGTEDASNGDIGYGGNNVARIFGGMVGGMSGGIISYSTLNLDGQVYNSGTQTDNGTNHMFVLTGGIAGIVEGSTTFRKITVQGGGKLVGQVNVIRTKFAGAGSPSTDAYTGGLVGYVTGYGQPDFNGVYLNLTFNSSNGDSDVFEAATMSSGYTGAVKTYYTRTTGVLNPAYASQYDSRANDNGGNSSQLNNNLYSATNVSEMRTSYGIGGAETSTISNVTLNNVYVSPTMANVIENHHPYAIHEIQYGQSTTANVKWVRWNWTYTVIDTTTLGNTAIFAPTTTIGRTDTAANVTADTSNQKRAMYFRLTGQGTSNFVYSITQGTDSLYDVYESAAKTYDKSGTVYVPVLYPGFKNNVTANVNRTGMNLTDTTSSTVNIYANTVSAESGSWLYMDFDMSKGYDGTDRLSDGYQGSGDSYTYTYNGDMLYVPAFAGYKTSFGTGEKISFTEDELNNLGLSSTHFSLSSSYTITNSGSVNYNQYNYLHWNGAGNVGTYTMTFNKAVSDATFTTKGSNHYYCVFMDSYPEKTIQVVPRQLDLEWYVGDLVYDGTVKDVATNFADLPGGTGLGNNDGSNLSVAVSYSASNENLLVQNKPYHAGDYTAKATLTYGGTTENPMTGNFTLANSDKAFTVGKVQMTVQPENAVSVYGDDHTAALSGAKVTVTGKWVGDDQSSFVFTAKTVDDTVGWLTTKGTYPTTVGVSLTEGAVEELLGDYDFVVTQGTLTVNERKINGTLKINDGVYNGVSRTATLTIDENVKVGTDTVYTLGYVLNGEQTEEAVNAGEYLIKITPEAGKYAIGTIVVDGKDELYADGATKLVIDRRSVDVTLAFDNGFVYDGANKVTGYTLQAQDGDAGVIAGEEAGLALSYNGEPEAVLPSTYTAVATFSNGNYKSGEIAGGTFTVERADLSEIRIDGNTATYDGTAKDIAYTLVGVAEEENIASLAGAVTITYNKSTALPVNAGEYAVEIIVAEGTAYKAATVSGKFTVNKADVTFSPVTETTYTGKNIEPEYSMTAPGMPDASSLKNYVTVQNTVILNASTYDVTLAFAGTSNYNAKTEKYSLTVKRADLAIDVADGQKLTYNANAQTPAYTVSALFDGDKYGAATLTVTGDNATEGQAVNAGDYTFTISVAESVNYNAAEKTVSFTIDRYKLTLIGATEQFVTVIKEGDTEVTEILRYLPSVDLALTDETGTYDETDLLFTTTPENDLEFSNGKASFTADISVDGLDENNYEFTSVTITVNVLDASITITVNNEETTLTSVIFGETLTIAANGSYGGDEAQEVSDVTWYSAADNYTSPLGAQPTDAGDYMAVFKYTFDAGSNYVTRALYLTISPKAVTVTLDGSAISVVYGDEITLADATYTTNVNGIALTVDYTTNAQKFSPAGSYVLDGTVSAVDGGNVANYSFTVVPGTLQIGKKTVYIKAADVTATYGDEVIFSDYAVYTDDGETVWTDYANAAQLKVSFSVQSGILTVGKYDVTVTGENANYNVNATTTKGKLTVEKRDVTITVSDVNVTYGTAELPEVSGSITGGSLVNGDTLGTITAEWKAEVEALGTLDAAEYALSGYATLSATLNSAQTGENYNISFTDATKLTVSPKTVKIEFIGWQTAGALGTGNTVTYNAGVWTPSATVDGIINEDVVEIAVNDESEIKNAGTYTRTLSLSGIDAGNYVAENYVATLEILPYKTEITVDQAEYKYTYGDTKTAIGQTVRLLEDDTDGGSFVQKYYVGTNTGVTGVQVNWDDVWNAGTYTVVVSYAGVNYTADPVNVTIVVNKRMIDKVDAKNNGDLGTSVYNAQNVNFAADDVADLSSFTGLESYINVVYRLGDNVVNVIRNAGEYTVDLVLAQNDNYGINGEGDSLLNVAATYTVTKAAASNLSFSLTYANKVYDGSDMSDYIRSVIAVSGINGEPVTGATIVLTDSAGQTLVPKDSGVYGVYAQASAMSNYEDMSASVSVGDFTIDKIYVAIDAIELPSATYTYDSFEKTLTGIGLQRSAVLKKVSYEYTSADYLSDSGAINAGVYNVKMTVLFDMLNSRFGSDVTLETVTDNEVECYKYEVEATMTINKAIPDVTIDKNTLASYFDGYDHAIEFVIAGVGGDSSMSASYDVSVSAGQSVPIDGVGTFTVSYYKDSAYNVKLTGEDGAAALPVTVLLDNGRTVPYYMMISFKSDNPNYADNDYKNSGYDMALYIMQSVVTLSFNSLSVPYGTLKNRSAANEYVNANMKYTYTVNDEGSASVNYDPEAMLVISYNLSSFDVNTGTYDISVEARAAKTEFADSVTAVVRNASAIKLNITAADVTDDMKAAFTDVSDSYGNKTYTAADLVWNVKGIMDEDVAYTVTYNGAADFSIVNAGDYELTVSIPQGNYKEWSGTVNLSIAKVGLDVIWTMDGNAPADGAFTKTYDGSPADLAIEVVGVDGVTARVVYVNSEGAEIDDQYVVGTHTAKAVLSDDNYFVNEDCLTVTVVINAIVLDEDTIKSWISDDSDVYGSVQGIDLTGLHEGFGATSVVYEKDGNTYDSTTIKTATVGEYSVTVTVSNGSSSGSATFVYTITKRPVTFTVNLSAKAGVRPTAADATIVSDKALASGDTAKVGTLTLSANYKDDLAFGTYDLKDYVSGVTVSFNKNADCYDYKVVLGQLTVSPDKAPVVTEITANYNSATVKFEKEGLYAYRIGSRGSWVTMSSESDTLLIIGLEAQKSYTIYFAYAGFTGVTSYSSVTTTADPAVLSQMIDNILEGGLTAEKQEAYDSILAYYEKIADEDKPEIQSKYDSLVAQFNALGNEPEGGEGVDAAVIAVCVVCLVLIVASIAGVIIAAVAKKRRNKQALEGDDFV